MIPAPDGPRQDTGHPFGLYCCLTAADGHVAHLATHVSLVPQVKAWAALLAGLGLGGTYRVEWLILEDAATRYAAGLGCDGCRVHLSCGCDIVQDVLSGRCPHGVSEAVLAAAERSGFLDAVPPPAGGQPGLDAHARAVVDLGGTAPPGSGGRFGRRGGKRKRR